MLGIALLEILKTEINKIHNELDFSEHNFYAKNSILGSQFEIENFTISMKN